MKRLVHVHDVQKLTGCLAALSRFISRLGEKALPHSNLITSMHVVDDNDKLIYFLSHGHSISSNVHAPY